MAPTASLVSHWKLSDVSSTTLSYEYLRASSIDGHPYLFRYTDGNSFFEYAFLRDLDGNIRSPLGYCGPTTNDTNILIEAWRAWQVERTRLKFKSEFIRFNPLQFNKTQFASSAYQIHQHGMVIVVDEHTYKLGRTRRQEINQAYANSNLRISKFYTTQHTEYVQAADSFQYVYNQSLDRLGALPKYYLTLRDFANVSSTLFTIHHKDEPVAFGIIVHNPNDSFLHLMGSTDLGRSNNTQQLLMDLMIKDGLALGHPVNVGGGLGSSDDDLFYFKSTLAKSPNTRLPYYTATWTRP